MTTNIMSTVNIQNRVLMEACVGFFNSTNICFKEYDRDMAKIRERFLRQLERKIETNVRLHQMNLMNAITMLYVNEYDHDDRPKRKKRSVWMFHRDADWWNTISNSEDEVLWMDLFRVNQETYFYLCEVLHNKLKPKENAVRESIGTEIKVAASLYKLATNESLAGIGRKFGLHKLSIQKAFYQFCEACATVLKKEYISLPEGEEITDIMQQFEDKIGLPQVLGAAEGSELPILTHAHGYHKSDGKNFIVLQAIIDPNGLFRDIALLEPQEDFTFYYSYLQQIMSSMPQKDVYDVPVPAYLISSRLDAPQSWLMKPYAEVNTPEEESFNDFLSKSSGIAQQTFRKLKGRFKILKEPFNISVAIIPKVVTTCCILNNIMEMKGIDFHMDSVEPEELYAGPPDVSEEPSEVAEGIRDHLKDYISLQYN